MSNITNKIYYDITSGRISLDEGCKKIIECVFLNPSKFAVTNMQEDEQSDFIIYLLEHLRKIVLNYNEGSTSFSTYLINVIRKLRCAWYRELYHSRARQISVTQYFINEEAKEICEDVVTYEALGNISTDSEKFTKSMGFKILVIALKSCYYLTPRHIQILSQRTGYSEELIYSYKEQLEKKIFKKIQRNIITTEKINNDYIKKNSCRHELMLINSDSTLSYRLKMKEFAYNKNWHRHIQYYKKNGCIRPSNNQIAEVLNERVHIIYRIIHELNKINVGILQ